MAGNMQKTKRRFHERKYSHENTLHHRGRCAVHCCGTHLDEADNAFFYVS